MLIYTIKGDLCNHETNKEVSIEEVETLQKIAIDTFYETFGPFYTDDNLQKYFDSAFNIETLKRITRTVIILLFLLKMTTLLDTQNLMLMMHKLNHMAPII